MFITSFRNVKTPEKVYNDKNIILHNIYFFKYSFILTKNFAKKNFTKTKNYQITKNVVR